MQIQDDRTDEERASHTWLVIGTDKVLSGWGKAANGPSYAAWACKPWDHGEVLAWVKARGDMLRIREVTEGGEAFKKIFPDTRFRRYRPRGPGHLHIYVVGPNHPSVARKYERIT